jgi:hypothetical protein
VAFQLSKKFKADQIKSRNLDTEILIKHYKAAEQLLIDNTTVEQTTDFFFCNEFAAGKHLLVIGTPATAQKAVFKSAAKGNDGFDKKKITIGTCFILEEEGKKVLCFYPNKSLSKGKKKDFLAAIKKIHQRYWGLIHEIRWLTAPIMVDSQDSSKVETIEEEGKQGATQAVQVPKEEVIEKAKNLKRGIDKLVKDVMPRYKKRETTPNDAAFVKALRKAGHLFLAQLPLTDEKTRAYFSTQKQTLESGLPQWKELEARIHSQKNKVESTVALKASLLGVIEKMKTNRTEIKTILKRVNLKQLG